MELPRMSREAAADALRSNLPERIKGALQESDYMLKTLSNLQEEIQKELAGFPNPQAAWEIWKEEYKNGNRDSCFDRLFQLCEGANVHYMGSLGEVIALKNGELDSILESVCLLEAKQDMLAQLEDLLGETLPKTSKPGANLIQIWGVPMKTALVAQLEAVLTDLSKPQENQAPHPLPKIPNINFGIEIEGFFLSNAPYETQKLFLEKILAAADPEGKWEVTNDWSIKNPILPSSGHGGLEIISPVLRGTDGMRRAQAVISALQNEQFETNRSCGLHIHIESGRDLPTLKKICADFLKEEENFAKLCSEHRRTNPTCTSNKTMIAKRSPNQKPEETIATAPTRKELLERTQHSKHCRLNITPACTDTKPPTVEFRLFDANISPQALIPTIKALELVANCIQKTKKNPQPNQKSELA